MIMNTVSDDKFVDFVDNNLPKEEMILVENELIEADEAMSAVHASIASAITNKKEISEILGTDDIFIKNLEESPRFVIQGDSIMVNSGSNYLNKSIMNITISKEEALKIQELFTVYKDVEDNQLTIDENLSQFYLSQCPGIYPEEAAEIVKHLHKGVLEFDTNLKKALAEGDINPTETFKAARESDCTDKQLYELYLNFLAALHVMNVQNFDEEQTSLIEDFDSIKNKLSVNGEVTSEMLDELESKISDALKDNTLCLAAADTMNNLKDAVYSGEESIKEMLDKNLSDFQTKFVMSMMTYIAYRNGEISSLKDSEVTPEAIAVAVSYGIEEAQVIEDVRTGKTTVDKAVKILKIIGGVALCTVLVLTIYYIAVHFSAFAFAAFVSILGTSALALIVAGGAALACGFGIIKEAGDVAESIVDWSGSAFDWIVSGWRETAWPAIKNKAQEFISWIGELFTNKTIVQATESTPIVSVAAN